MLWTDVQAEAAARAAGANPVIVRNQGSLGARDLHLENFSVSNGGKDLIQARAYMLLVGDDRKIFGSAVSSTKTRPSAF